MLALVLGDRDVRLQRVVNRLLGDDLDSDVGVIRFDAQEAALEDIVNAASMGSFFGDSQAVLVQNVPLPTRKENPLWKWLSDSVADFPDSLRMVVTFHTDGLNRADRSRNEKKARTLEKKGAEVHVVPTLDTRSSRAALSWVFDIVRENGMTIEPAAADYLVHRSAADGSALEQEVLKVAALIGFSGNITRADIDRADPYPAEEVVWDYLGAVSNREPGRALQILGTTLSQGAEPEFVLAILGTNLRRLLDVTDMTRSGVPAPEMQSALRVADWQLKRLQNESGSFRPGELRTMLRKLVDLDLRHKTGGLRHGGLARGLEALTVRFCYRIFEGAGAGAPDSVPS